MTATAVAGIIMVLTLAEDVLTAGAGVADDPASLAAALSLGSYILAMP